MGISLDTGTTIPPVLLRCIQEASSSTSCLAPNLNYGTKPGTNTKDVGLRDIIGAQEEEEALPPVQASCSSSPDEAILGRAACCHKITLEPIKIF